MQRVLVSLAGLCALLLATAGPLAPTARAVPSREPVIIIPGVAGSEFTAANAFRLSVEDGRGGVYTRNYAAGEKVWVNTWEAAAFGEDDYFDALKLKPDGVTPVAPELAVSGIYWPAYSDLIGYLERQGYVLGVDLWVFPYDWRRDIRITNEQLDGLVTQALTAANGSADPALWSVRRADIVAHSMGGLVARSYVSDPARASRVDQLITLGSPQLGAAKFLKTLIYGDTFGPWFLGIGLNPSAVNDVVQNMPGAMQLLPTRAYYRFYDNSDGARLRPYVEDRDVDGNGSAGGALDHEGARALLLNLGKNRLAIDLAASFHDPLDGQRSGGVNGVRWAALIGYGYGTLGQIREYTGACWSWFRYVPCPKRDETPTDGDGTVAIMSAAMGDPWRNTLLDSGAQLWYIQREHGELVKRNYVLGIASGDGPALEWIGGLLRGSVPMAAPASGQGWPEAAEPGRPGPAPAEQLRGIWISALGPVALQVRGPTGLATGRAGGVEPGAAATDLPESRYEQLPGAEFAFVQRQQPYTVELAAEGAGSVDLKLRVLGDDERTVVYLGVPLGSEGRARLELAPGAGADRPSWPALQVDADGDGLYEASAPASAVLDQRASLDTTAPALKLDAPEVQDGIATLRWYVEDDLAGVFREQALVELDGAAPLLVANGAAVALPSGEHRLVVLAQDRAGNAASDELVFSVP